MNISVQGVTTKLQFLLVHTEGRLNYMYKT